METVIPRLHATASEPLPFDPSLEIRSFLLEHALLERLWRGEDH